jgi:transposase
MYKTNKFSPEVRERAVRMVLEHRGEYLSLWAAAQSIAPQIGCVPHTPHEWVRRQQVDSGELKTWADRRGIKIEYIQPGKPLQNAYVERFSRTVRYEWLAPYHFDSIRDATDFTSLWM